MDKRRKGVSNWALGLAHSPQPTHVFLILSNSPGLWREDLPSRVAAWAFSEVQQRKKQVERATASLEIVSSSKMESVLLLCAGCRILSLGKVAFETKPEGNLSCGVGGLCGEAPSMHRMLSSAEGLLQAQACPFSSSPTPTSLDFLLTRLQWRSPSHLWTTSEPSPSCLRSLGTTSSTHSICKDKILTGLSQMSRCGLLLLFWFLVLQFQKRTLCMDADN